MAFKRIAKEPLPVTPKPKVPTREQMEALSLPKQADIDGMTAEEAYKAGQKFAEQLGLGKPKRTVTTYVDPRSLVNATPGFVSANVVPNTTNASPNTFVYAPKTSPVTHVAPPGAGLNPAQQAALAIKTKAQAQQSNITLLFKESDTGIGFKQWATWIEGNTVVVEWGHCDKAKQEKRFPFNAEWRAQTYMNDCIAAKLKKGYRRTK